MGGGSRTVAGALLLIGAAGCGDPFVVIGDAPGVVRVIAGTPTIRGDSIGSLASESELDTPQGLALTEDGTLFIADRGNVRILAVTPADEITVVIDHSLRPVEPRMSAPSGIALDADGQLIVADPDAQRVWRVDPEDPDAGFAPIAGNGTRGAAPDTADALLSPLRDPTGVLVGADGRIYFSERTGHVVRRLDADGRIITIAGRSGDGGFSGDGGPATQAELFRPIGLAVADGVLYIADSGNNRVRAVDLASGTISTVAGSGGRGFSGDGGPAVDAFLDEPVAVAAADGVGNLFIADTNNHRIRMVNLNSGAIRTFAGTGATSFNGDLIAAGEAGLDTPLGLTLSRFQLLFIADTGHHIILRAAVGFLSSV